MRNLLQARSMLDLRALSRILTVVVGLSMGLATPAFAANGTLSVSFSTTEAGGAYAPRNVVVVWVEDAQGAFVKTLGRWSGARTMYLLSWMDSAGIADTDAVSGATRQTHDGALSVEWDLLDRDGELVPDGSYTIRMELADGNSSSPDQNNEGVFSFVKGDESSSETTAGGGFEGVAIDYTVRLESCDNGVVDTGETCDPPGSCPTSCEPSGDACTPNTLRGSASTCTAECVPVTIVACTGGDGCCQSGCNASNDSDCGDGDGDGDGDGGGGDQPGGSSAGVGGCAAGAGGGGLAGLLLLGLALAIVRRRAPR